MAFRHSSFFQSFEKSPETLQKEALVDRIVKDILLPHDSRDMLSSRYLNKVYDNYGENLGNLVDSFEGSAAEELIKQASSPLTETAAKEIGIVGHALVSSGVVDKLHVSDRLVNRSTVIKTILERLIAKYIVDAQVRERLMPLADLFQSEYNALKQAEFAEATRTCSVA